MALHTPPVEKMEDAFAVAQLHHEIKVIGIKATFDEAKELCADKQPGLSRGYLLCAAGVCAARAAVRTGGV